MRGEKVEVAKKRQTRAGTERGRIERDRTRGERRCKHKGRVLKENEVNWVVGGWREWGRIKWVLCCRPASKTLWPCL